MARLLAQSAVQPGVSTILGQIAASAPGAPDFHVVDLNAWRLLGPGDDAARITYQARPPHPGAVLSCASLRILCARSSRQARGRRHTCQAAAATQA
jgi:hypothetical protein